jgi:methylmalonyl-CoA mutase cobalamin-binding domain/chain
MNQNSLNHKKFLELLRAGDTAEINNFVSSCIEVGLSPHYIYIDIIFPALVEIGELWSQGQMSIAEEHVCTEITKSAMAVISQKIKHKNANGLKAVLACVKGETHYLGAKMFADFLTWDGWSCDFLGQDNPPSTISEWVGKVNPTIVGLSICIGDHFDSLVDTINQMRSNNEEIKIVVGGILSEFHKDKLKEMDVLNVFSNPIEALDWIRPTFLQRNQSLLVEEYLLTVGKRIKQIRNASGINQQELADKSDLDRTYISAVENGRQNISLSVTLRIAQALNTSVEKITSQGPM